MRFLFSNEAGAIWIFMWQKYRRKTRPVCKYNQYGGFSNPSY
jgi:hypothetical protein